jgi:hypothetical protein
MAATDPYLPSATGDDRPQNAETPDSPMMAASKPDPVSDHAGPASRLAQRIVALQPFRDSVERQNRAGSVVVPLTAARSDPAAASPPPTYRVGEAHSLDALGFDPKRLGEPANEPAVASKLALLAETLGSVDAVGETGRAPPLASVSSILPSHPPAAPLLAAAATNELGARALIQQPPPLVTVPSPAPALPYHPDARELAPGFAAGLAAAIGIGYAMYVWLVS